MEHPIRVLINALESYLHRFDHAGAKEAASAIARWNTGGVGDVPAQPVPACGFLVEAIAAIHGADEVQAALTLALPHLSWTTYDLYPRAEIGGRFPLAHAFTSLIGGDSPVVADDFELGLFLVAPRTFYRDRHHKAPELYAPLTGPHHWRFGTDGPWLEKPAHEPVWNDPWAVHATLVRDVPFLSIYGWTRDVNAPARTVAAGDWAMIEGAL